MKMFCSKLKVFLKKWSQTSLECVICNATTKSLYFIIDQDLVMIIQSLSFLNWNLTFIWSSWSLSSMRKPLSNLNETGPPQKRKVAKLLVINQIVCDWNLLKWKYKKNCDCNLIFNSRKLTNLATYFAHQFISVFQPR